MPDDFQPIGPTGQFPDGKLRPDDDGELAIAIGHQKRNGQVFLEFNTPVRWTAMSPAAARGLAALLMNHAHAVDGKGPNFEFQEPEEPTL